MFVKDTIIPSSMSGNLSIEENSQKSFSGASDNESLIEIVDTPLTADAEALSPSTSISQTTSTSNYYTKHSINPNIKKRRMERDNTQKIAILQKAQDGEKKPENPDAQFLLSLLPYFNGLQALEKLELRSEIQNAVLNVYRRKSYSSNSYACNPEVSLIQTTSSQQPVQRQIYRPYNNEKNVSLQTSEQTQWNLPNMNTTIGVDILSGNMSLDTNQHLYNVNNTLD
ncbi:unnamed protein product [Macrosiphum euphorbiae]|uniref:BESS domain-containing protein n=1 Tax=Macrosiphum euphorbiae TaxID=13131 RepID=A0AAV0XXD6_9HEMI|nr:unnamed protein product [Macrosiphum euphorbiae]